MVLLDIGSDLVTPPWLPLAMVIVLLGLLGFLYWSMRRNINRIDFEETPEPDSTDSATTTDSAQSAPDRTVSQRGLNSGM